MMVRRLLFFPVWLFAFHLINALGGILFYFSFELRMKQHSSPNTSVDHAVLFIYFGENVMSSPI